MSTPDQIEPVIGWRSWDVRMGLLSSPIMTARWYPGKKVTGYCQKEQYEEWAYDYYDDPCQGDACQCGVNAFYHADELIKQPSLYKPNMVVGEVYLWGYTRAFEKGYRAEFAYPKTLYATCPSAANKVKELSEKYSCEYGGVLKVRRHFFEGPMRSFLVSLASVSTFGIVMSLLSFLPSWILLAIFTSQSAGSAFTSSLENSKNLFLFSSLVLIPALLILRLLKLSKDRWKAYVQTP